MGRSGDQADQGGGDGGGGDDDQEGGPQEEGDGAGGQAGQAGVDGEAAVVAAEGLRDDQGGQEGRGEVLEGCWTRGGGVRRASRRGPAALMAIVARPTTTTLIQTALIGPASPR